MNQKHNLVCQNCHGTMGAMANGIEQGRVPWVQEPRCADCHLSKYAENPGTLFRNSSGHGGVMCEGCHNSTHADLPSRVDADNANNIALQGFAGSLKDCRVCHGVMPAGQGPHGLVLTDVEHEVLAGAVAMRCFPNPVRTACTIELPGTRTEGGRLIVYDALGRIVRMLTPTRTPGGALRATWDATDGHGGRVRAGVYFARWQQGAQHAAARLTVVD
jgi:hypothetical protein